MNADDFFCPSCKRIKSRCACHKKSIAEKNMEIFRESCRDESLKSIFQADYEVVDFREIEADAFPSVPVDSLNITGELKIALKSKGILRLYEFQKEALELIRNRRDVIITAPTGMGKTEAFAIPMIEMLKDGGKGLIIYPTKALTKDQLEKIAHYAGSCELNAVKFDGDSGYGERKKVYSGKADIVLTNPDMIDHHLRNTPEFREFAEQTRIIVFDELHSYSGFLGSSIYWLVRRIERFTSPQIAACSATIDNPDEFGRLLFDRNFDVVRFDGRGSPQRMMVVCGSFYDAVRDLVLRLGGRKILIFGNSYKSVETVAWILERNGIRCLVHKAGLPKKERERAERMFRDGRIRVLVSTSTLELGIDIGDVDCVISELVPFPVFLQRAGRAGRMKNRGLGILVLRDETAIGEYYRRNIDEYYREKMMCYAERWNELAARHHILSMAREMPLLKNEVEREIAERMVDEGLLIDAGDFYIAQPDQQLNSGIRGAGKRVKIVFDGRVIGERALPMAVRELHPNAVFLHNRKRYVVERLDLKGMRAIVEETDANLTTSPIYTALPKVVRVAEKMEHPVKAHYCEMELAVVVSGYTVRKPFDDEKVRVEYLARPLSYTFRTRGFVFTSPYPEKMNYEDFFAGSFHALEHAIIETSDAITGGGSNAIGGISTSDGYIFVYDATEGGNGMSKLLFSRMDRAFRISLDVLENCDCKRVDGCPRCTYSYQCGNNNHPLNRIGAIDILKKIVSGVKRSADLSIFEEVRDFVYYP